ncbi:MAG: dTMP kinase [Alphaproteobacteria bacterium]|nr:dTMP kinase [Alphaproteobacteria bacterium]
MKKGLFITFEGGEGVGKSTQIRLLHDYIQQKYGNKEIILTREPGGSAGAEEIRSLLLNGKTNRWDKLSELLLFSAARRNHLTEKIWPAMEKKAIVLCDRFFDSTVAYQCYGYGFNEEMYHQAQTLYQMIAGYFEPDLTFILDLDVEIGLQRSRTRAGNNEQRFEDMQLSFHQNLRKGFLEIAYKNPKRCIVIDASQTIDDIHKQIVQSFEEHIAL